MYIVLKDLCLPAKPSDKKHVELAELLSKYYKLEVSSVAATYLFQQCVQSSTESIRDYVNRLKRQAVACQLDCHYDRALRDQFIAGIASVEVRTEILSCADASSQSFDDVAEFAITKEAAKIA